MILPCVECVGHDLKRTDFRGTEKPHPAKHLTFQGVAHIVEMLFMNL